MQLVAQVLVVTTGNYYNFLCGDSANNTTSVYEINFGT